MEEENFCSSLPFITDSVLQQPQQDSCTAAEHSYINGEQEVVVWGDTEVQINEQHEIQQLHLPSQEGGESPEEIQQWEQIIWPVRPMTSTAAQLSFATVQWDMPGTASETPTLVTDSSSANKQDSGGVMSVDITSPSLQQSQDINAELFTQEEREEEDGNESWLLLNSDLEFTGNGSEVCTVCVWTDVV